MTANHDRVRPAQPEHTYSRKRRAEDLETVEKHDSVNAELPHIIRHKRLKGKESKSVGSDDIAPVNFHPQFLADLIGKSTKRFEPDLTAIELEAKRISASAFVDTSDWVLPRELSNLPRFLEQYNVISSPAPNHSSTIVKKGSPSVIVLTCAGLRAADITRNLRVFQSKDAIVAKLFAKHIKLSKAVEFVKRTRISIGVGTPSRILDLFNSGALSFGMLSAIIVDVSYRDEKKRSILDMRETHQPLMDLLSISELSARYNQETDRVSLVLF